MPEVTNWKTIRVSNRIDFPFPGLNVIVANDIVSFPLDGETEQRVVARLTEAGITVREEIDLPIVPESDSYRPAPPAAAVRRQPPPPVVRRALRTPRTQVRPVYEENTEAALSPPGIPGDVPLPVEEMEEEMQKQFILSKAEAESIVEELAGLVRTSLSFYYKNLRKRVCEVALQVLEKERDYLNLSVSKMTFGYVSKALEKVITTGLDKRKIAVIEKLGGFGITEEQVETAVGVVRSRVRESMSGFTQSEEEVNRQLDALVTFEVEKEELFAEVAAQKDIDVSIKERMRQELIKMSQFPYVQKMYCTASSFVVEVKNVKVLDPEDKNREYFLGEYEIWLNLTKVEDSGAEGILRLVHMGTPNADYMHPHVCSRGNNVCFGSGNTSQGIMKLIGEFDIALVVQVLYGFLNGYNPDSPYQKPYSLMRHWMDRDNWKVRKK